jgi:hypothetical protein
MVAGARFFPWINTDEFDFLINPYEHSFICGEFFRSNSKRFSENLSAALFAPSPKGSQDLKPAWRLYEYPRV